MKLTEVNTFIFQDLDGCLADFDKRVREITGKSPSQMPQSQMWPQLADQKIETNSPHHKILKMLSAGETLTNDLAQRTKAIRLLEGLKLLDKRMNVTDKGQLILGGLDKGEDFHKKVDLYNSLEWMPDGKILWEYVLQHEPIVLTGSPMGNWAEPQKRKWCARELGHNIPVLVGLAHDKAKLAMEFLGKKDSLDGSILIDDRPKHQAVWESAGGVWITHTDAASTIAELKNWGL